VDFLISLNMKTKEKNDASSLVVLYTGASVMEGRSAIGFVAVGWV